MPTAEGTPERDRSLQLVLERVNVLRIFIAFYTVFNTFVQWSCSNLCESATLNIYFCNNVETGKVRHVGRHSERHTRSVMRSRDVPDSRRSSRGSSRKEKKQVLLTKPIILVCSNRGRNDGGHQQRRDGLFVRTWKAHHTMYR